MNIPSPTHEGHGEGLSLTGAKDVSDLDAAREQRWNERQLAEPVLHPRMKVWTYREGAIVLGRSQHALADRPEAAGMSNAAAGDAGGVPPGGLADSEAVRLPLVKRGAGGGAVLVGPWLLSASLLLPLDDPRMAMTSVADSYRWLGEAMVATLAELGVTARAVPPAERIPQAGGLCPAAQPPWRAAGTGCAGAASPLAAAGADAGPSGGTGRRAGRHHGGSGLGQPATGVQRGLPGGAVAPPAADVPDVRLIGWGYVTRLREVPSLRGLASSQASGCSHGAGTACHATFLAGYLPERSISIQVVSVVVRPR